MIQKTLAMTLMAFTTQSFSAEVPKNVAASTVKSFETIFGVTEGKRRNHTKGFCFQASLLPMNKAIDQYSNSPIFKRESEVVGRFSIKGGNANAADNKGGEYGMSLSIAAGSETHLMSLNTLDFFPVATPEAFAELMHAKSLGKGAVKAFKSKNKDLQRFKTYMSKQTKSLTPYEGNTYNSINSFYLVNDDNNKTAVRWSFVPTSQQDIVVDTNNNFFFDNLQSNLKSKEVSWDMVFTLANSDDAVGNAAIQWTGKHTTINAARLKIKSISTEENGNCESINYDPLVLSSGFAPSKDPLLQARRDSYAISFGKRIEERYKQTTNNKGASNEY